MNEFYKTLVNPKGKFGIWGIVLLVVVGVSLMVVPGLILDSSRSTSQTPFTVPADLSVKDAATLPELEQTISERISRILSQVEGAGAVAVSVTLESGLEQDYAQNISDDRSTVEEKDTSGGTRSTTSLNQKTEVVFSQDYKGPLVIKEIGPRIKGVLVVAEGAKDGAIRASLTQALQAMLDLPAHRIMVLPKESR